MLLVQDLKDVTARDLGSRAVHQRADRVGGTSLSANQLADVRLGDAEFDYVRALPASSVISMCSTSSTSAVAIRRISSTMGLSLTGTFACYFALPTASRSMSDAWNVTTRRAVISIRSPV